jgi:hypothetical protein
MMNLMHSITSQSWFAGLKVSVAGCHTCNRSVALRNFSARKAGIKMHDRWYCSSECFIAAAEDVMLEMLGARHGQARRTTVMPLGLSLLSRGLLTSAQLKAAADAQRQSGGDIGELLVRGGAVSEKQVTEVLASQWNCPVFTVRRHAMRDKINIPATLIDLHEAVPVHYVAATRLLLVGFVRGVEYGLLYAIEKITGCRTQPCFVTPSDYEIQKMELKELLLGPGGESLQVEVKFDEVKTSREMARVLCKHVVDSEADEAVVGRSKNYVWARLKCSHRDMDILFRAS